MRALSAVTTVAAFLLTPFALVTPAAAQGRAGTVAIGFAPPLATSYLYRIEQKRLIEGRESRFVTERLLRFDKAPDGYWLSVTLRRVDTDAPAAGAEPFRAALLPLVGIQHRFLLDANGQVKSLEDDAAIVARAADSLRRMQADFPQGGPRHRAATNILTLLSGLSAEGRLALLSGEVRPLFLFANTIVLGGEGRGLKSMAGSPLGRPVPVEGRVLLSARQGDMLSLTEQLGGEGATVHVDYRVDRASGLVMEQARTLALEGLSLKETRLLTPAP